MLKHIRQALQAGGRVIVQDQSLSPAHRKRPRQEQMSEHEIAPELVERELRDASFEIVERRDPFVRPPADPSVVFWLIVAQAS